MKSLSFPLLGKILLPFSPPLRVSVFVSFPSRRILLDHSVHRQLRVILLLSRTLVFSHLISPDLVDVHSVHVVISLELVGARHLQHIELWCEHFTVSLAAPDELRGAVSVHHNHRRAADGVEVTGEYVRIASDIHDADEIPCSELRHVDVVADQIPAVARIPRNRHGVDARREHLGGRQHIVLHSLLDDRVVHEVIGGTVDDDHALVNSQALPADDAN